MKRQEGGADGLENTVRSPFGVLFLKNQEMRLPEFFFLVDSGVALSEGPDFDVIETNSPAAIVQQRVALE